MNIYLVVRTKGVKYDEHDSYVCYAKDMLEAEELGKTLVGGQDDSVWAAATITHIGFWKDADDAEIIMSSYIAG